MTTKSGKNQKKPDSAQPEGQNKTLLGQILVELGYITIYQLDEALHIQRSDASAGKEQKPLGQILLELGYCGPNQLIRAIQVQVDYRKAQEKEKEEK
jgi:type IV pilus assembly protein PilB